MKLTEELFQRGKKQKEICSIIDDNYVLLHKTIPCSYRELNGYLENMNNAKANGINISCVTDYKLIPESTHTFGNISYSSGVFIEEKAKGITPQDSTCTFLRPNIEYNYDEVANEYYKKLNEYVELLEYQANADQEIFDKLVHDVLEIKKYNLSIDPKPLNFFYEKDIGYTLIDPIPYGSHMEKEMPYYPTYILSAIFGYGCPYISGNDSKRLITMDLLIRLNNASNILINKATIALKKYNFSDEDINQAINRTTHQISAYIETIDINDLSYCIQEIHNNQKEKSL